MSLYAVIKTLLFRMHTNCAKSTLFQTNKPVSQKYKILLTALLFCFLLTVQAQTPNLTVTTSTPSACAGTTFTLSASGADSYTWQPGNTSNNTASYTESTSGVKTYTVWGADATGAVATKTISITILPIPPTVTVSPSSASICKGDSLTLNLFTGVTTFSFGTQAKINTTTMSPYSSTDYPAPYTAYFGGQRMQILILASELSASGFTAGSTINSVQFPVYYLGTSWTNGSTTGLTNFKVSIGSTSSASINSFQNNLTQVYYVSSFKPKPGYDNIHVFNNGFVWNGVSNIIIETTFSNNVTGGPGDGVFQYNSPTSFQSCIVNRYDKQTSAAIAANNTVVYSYSARPDFRLNGSPISIAWQPSLGIATISLTAITGSITTKASPAITTNYSLSSSNGICSNNQNNAVTISIVNGTKLSVSDIITPASICSGSSLNLTPPTISNESSVTSRGWYLNNVPISTTTTLSISNSGQSLVYQASNKCGSASSNSVVVNVFSPPVATITPSAASICNKDSVTLRVITGVPTFSFGTQGANNESITPFSTLRDGQRFQMMVRASELTSAGVAPGAVFDHINFFVTWLGTNVASATALSLQSFQVRLGFTTNTTLTNFQDNLSTVYNTAVYTATTGVNAVPLSGTITWDGTNNVVFDICYSNLWGGVTPITSSTALRGYNSNSGYNSCIFYQGTYQNFITISTSTIVTQSSTWRPDFQLYFVQPQLSWSPSTELSNNNQATVIAKPTSTTIYTLTSSNGACATTTTAGVTVSRVSKGTSTLPPISICQGTSANLSASALAPGLSYAWTPSVSVSPATEYTTVATPGATTVYTCTITDSQMPSCSGMETVTVTLNPFPTTTVTSSSFTVACSSMPATLTASGANSYTWSPATGLNSSTGDLVVANPSVTTVYTVTGSNNCNTSTATTTVTVLPQIDPNIFPSNTWNAYCYGDKNLGNYYGYYTEDGTGPSYYDFNSTSRWSSAISGTLAPSPSNANSTNGKAYSGCTVPNADYSISFKRANFACSVYSISIAHDDDMVLLINGTQVAQHTGTAIDNNIWVGALDAHSTVEIRHVQTTGTAYISATLTPVVTSTTQSVWLGGTSADWFSASNWCGNGVPTPSIDVLIPAAGPKYMPLIGASGAQCKGITISGAVMANDYNNAIPAATLSIDGAYGLNVYGDWINNGVLNAGTGTVNLTGATSSSVSSTTSETFYNLQINKTGPATISVPIGIHQVAGKMSFINGVVNQNATLRILDGGTVEGASNRSYVNGPVSKYGTSAFTFPIGSGGLYRPASISPPSVTTDNFTAQYFNSSADAIYPVISKDPTLNNVSTCEYWIISRTGGASNVDVNLTWNSNSCGIGGLSDLRVARWDADEMKWKDHGNGGTTGNFITGSVITNTPVAEFSPFTLASVSAINPLPIEMLGFSCHTTNNNSAQLNWQTATEKNSRYFVPERSINGIQFDSLGYVGAAGNSMQVRTYSFVDPYPGRGLSYYRLKKVDLDGSYSYSNLCVTDNEGNSGVLVYPNPASSHIVIDYYNASEMAVFSLHDISGRQLVVPYSNNNSTFTLDVSGLQRGLYFITLTIGAKQFVTKISIL